MINKVLGIISRNSHPTGLQAYYNNVRWNRAAVGPTYDEARMDFRNHANSAHGSYGKVI